MTAFAGAGPHAAALTDAEFRLIAESIPHVVWMAGPDGSTQYFNRQGLTYAGYPPDGDYDTGWASLIHPDDIDRARTTWNEAIRAQTPYRVDYRVRRFDGEYRWHAIRGLPIRDARGEVVRWIGTATDIEETKSLETDLRTAQRETAEALTMLETLLAKAPVGFAIIDRDFRLVRLNEMLAAMGRSTVAEQVGKTIAETVPELWPHVEPIYRHVLDSGEAVVDIEVTGPASADPSVISTMLTS
ncbi:MAG: PAS domain-containing protein, partial [Acidimicrobiales bacterium]